jgi:hypothetical protein
MNATTSNSAPLVSDEERDGKTALISQERQPGIQQNDDLLEERSVEEIAALERKLVRKVDLRLCTIAGILCSLNLIDSGIISSASVSPGFFDDLGLGVGNRYVSFGVDRGNGTDP